jgi:hypothetical protein
MFDWLSRLLHRKSPMFHGLPATGLPERTFPTAENISDWDDQGLYDATSYEAALRYENGFETLNEAEQFLCCFFMLQSYVNNGGAGHWVELLCPLSARQTPIALRQIGAGEMAAFTEDVLRPLGDTTGIRSIEAWAEHYDSMPEDIHNHWETLTPRYCSLENHFLESAYAYARANWDQVRPADFEMLSED